jgi:general secretion pathway protein F
MPEFRYRAADRQGALREGQLRADSADAALRQLRQQGLTPIGLTEGCSSDLVVWCPGADHIPSAPGASSRRGGRAGHDQ